MDNTSLPLWSGMLVGLSLMAFGTGGIKPCVSAFGGDQLDPTTQARELAAFFALFYVCVLLYLPNRHSFHPACMKRLHKLCLSFLDNHLDVKPSLDVNLNAIARDESVEDIVSFATLVLWYLSRVKSYTFLP